jgi:hypothetical protein
VSIAASLGVYGDRSVIQNTFLSSGYVWQYIYIYTYINFLSVHFSRVGRVAAYILYSERSKERILIHQTLCSV